MSKLFLAALISLLCLTSCTARTPEATPEPLPTLPEETVIPEPSPTPEPWSEEEVTVLAKMVWGEARGVPSDTEKAACVWCALNLSLIHI